MVTNNLTGKKHLNRFTFAQLKGVVVDARNITVSLSLVNLIL
jgi:hypothetical protein